MTKETTDLAARIRGELASRQISNMRVAAAIDKSEPTTSRKLSGKVPITLNELHKIADLIGVPAAELLPAGSNA